MVFLLLLLLLVVFQYWQELLLAVGAVVVMSASVLKAEEVQEIEMEQQSPQQAGCMWVLVTQQQGP